MAKILLIANYKGHVGGISGQVELLARHLRSDEYEVCVYSTIGNPIQRVARFFKLLFVVRHFDILHIHGCSYRGMLPVVYGIVAGMLWHKRTIVTFHGGDADRYFSEHAQFARRWLGRADEVIVLNGYQEQVFRSYNIPCRIIPNILEDKLVVDRLLSDTLSPHFISIRHLRELYNIPCILRAFERVQMQVPDASLTLLGQGDQRPKLEQYVVDHHLQNVRFVGQVSQYEVQSYLNEATIMLSAPRIDNMPVSVMEAMQTGLLVISSRVGGVPYVIEDNKTGLLFEHDNDEEMAEKMMWALQHPQEAQQLVNNARESVKQYSWTAIRPLIYNAYNL